jgi:tripartite-type tricarboxylate transporter receptor subunit TctC
MFKTQKGKRQQSATKTQARHRSYPLGGSMKFQRRQFLHLATAAAVLPALPRIAHAQAWPTRPVRIVVGYAAGGVNDILARLVGKQLSDRLGQPVVVENKPGAGSNIATETVVRSPADGYTLLMVSAANAINTTLYEQMSFNFLRDISPVAGLGRVSNVLVVHPSFPAHTVPEFIAYAKANPAKISMASAGVGSPQHVGGELFKMMAGVDMVHVPYRGGAPALADLIGGQVQCYFSSTASSIEFIKTGKIRPLGVTSTERSAAVPDIPAIAEFVPGYEASAWYGLGAPKGTPKEVVERLNRETLAALADPALSLRLSELGVVPIKGTAAEFGAMLEDETGKWGKVVKFANIKPE